MIINTAIFSRRRQLWSQQWRTLLTSIGSSFTIDSMATCSSSLALPLSPDHCTSPCGAMTNSARQQDMTCDPIRPRDDTCQGAEERCQGETRCASPALCDRGCPMVNGICPISEAEWRQAVLDKEAASTSDDQKQAPASATTIHDDQRKWQQRGDRIVRTHLR